MRKLPARYGTGGVFSLVGVGIRNVCTVISAVIWRIGVAIASTVLAAQLVSLPSSAEDGDDTRVLKALMACSEINEPADRLECYDGVGRQAKRADTLTAKEDPMSAEMPVASISPSTPVWRSERKQSKIDSSVVVTAWIESQEEISLHAGETYRPVLGIDCQKKNTIAYIASRAPLGIEETTLDLRIDDARPFKVELELSPDYKSAGWWLSAEAISFVKKLAGKRILAVRLSPVRDVPIEVTFDLTGMKKAIAPLAKACSW
jgi:type VI secretion system VasI family protein